MGEPVQSLLKPLEKSRSRRAQLLQQRRRHTFLLPQKHHQQVLHINGLMVSLLGQPLSVLQRFLGFEGQLIETHNDFGSIASEI